METYIGNICLNITKKQALKGSHSGSCDDDISELLQVPAIKRQLSRLNNEEMSNALREYGAWTDEELQNRGDNEARLLWIACVDIAEEEKLWHYPKKKKGKN